MLFLPAVYVRVSHQKITTDAPFICGDNQWIFLTLAVDDNLFVE